MKTIAAEALEQLGRAGYLPYVLSYEERPNGIHGRVMLALVPLLQSDERFASGCLYGLHTDVGDCLTDFRSYNGSLGRGSMQVVIDKQTGRFFADVDAHNPYQDVVRFMGHAFAEVVPHFVMKLFRRNKESV